MKILLFLLAFNSSAHAAQSYGQPGGGPFGLGIVLGAPTAITGKYNLNRVESIDAGLSFFSGSWVLLYGDYLKSYPGAFGSRDKFAAALTPYIGIGGGVFAWNSNDYGGRPWGWRDHNYNGIGLYSRVPLGLEWRPHDPTICVFAELAPGIALLPGMWITLDIGVGIRYFF